MYTNEDYVKHLERSIEFQKTEMLNCVDQMINTLKACICTLEVSKEYEPQIMDMRIDETVDNVSWKAKHFGQYYNYYCEMYNRLDAIKEYNGTKEG